MELQKDRENLKDIRAFAADESGVGVIELVLILVVLIGLVIILRSRSIHCWKTFSNRSTANPKRFTDEVQGEVTVFLTMILVSIMTLLLVVVESARETGARLYLRMAADSSMDSVMAQYHRGCGRITGSWDLKQGKRKDWNRNLAIFCSLCRGGKLVSGNSCGHRQEGCSNAYRGTGSLL